MKKIFSLILCLLISFTITFGAFAVPNNAESANALVEQTVASRIEIEFIPNVSSERISAFITENNIVAESFETLMDGKYTCGFVVNQQDSFDVVWDDFVSIQTALLNEGIEHNLGTSIGDDLENTLELLLNEEFQMSLICYNSTVMPSEDGNLAFLDDEIIKSAKHISSSSLSGNNTAEVSKIEQRNSADSWTPTSGGALALKSVLEGKDVTYMQAHYSWNSDAALSYFSNNSNCTIEADIVFYNYDDEAICTGWDTSFAYSTNQYRPYRDTQAFDSDHEPTLSVGCSDASTVEKGVDYYWIAYGNSTESDSCNAKLNIQRGHRFPSFIYESASCVFPDETWIAIPFDEWVTTDYEQFYNP